MERTDYIIGEFGKCGITLSAKQAEKLLTLYEFLVEYNKNVNLTAVTEFEEVVAKHFVDSVLPFAGLDIKQGASFIDVGTGAGFPALPLLIYREDLKATLLEALEKRCVFLRKACELLGLSAEIVHGRAEDYAKDNRERFDFATARAVAALPVLSEYCLPYVKVDGRFIALKSVNETADAAENAIKLLGGRLREIKDYVITNNDSRRLFIIEKISHTSPKYPRNPAAIKKKPL
ncbi:MAG: 16S rRNA (guanine(527)-N(7))-methyltransferase RsmG [Eubacterium sp.]|nr:16S rRNA (guanine(527)-N(7))-methyltransferase RsmG [Eubacterium sp.]